MNYNSKTLLDVKFKKNVKGYDALEVDQTLDQVIVDYAAYEKQVRLDKETIDKLKAELETLKNEKRDVELELAKLQKKMDGIPDSPDVNKNNIAYLKRISALEKALYKKGVDPKKIN